MSIFVLKIIACVSMFLDHVKYYTNFNNFFTIYFGRFAFPIYAFLITEGFLHTKNLKKYCTRLFIFALISQIPFYIFISGINSSTVLNVFFTLLFGLLSIISYNYFKKPILQIIAPVVLAIISEILHFDYGAYGVLLVFMFYMLKNNKLLMTIGFIILTFFKYITFFVNAFGVRSIGLFLSTICAIIPILFYNGKLRTKSKILFLRILSYTFVNYSIITIFNSSLINNF